MNIEDLGTALFDPAVRKHWVMTVLEEVRNINLQTHIDISNGDVTDKLIKRSARLQGILWALNQISASKTSLELERRHNPAGAEPTVAVSRV